MYIRHCPWAAWGQLFSIVLVFEWNLHFNKTLWAKINTKKCLFNKTANKSIKMSVTCNLNGLKLFCALDHS